MEFELGTEKKRSESEYNYAVAFLGRINAIFYIICAARSELDINTWSTQLVNLFAELYTDMDKDDKIVKYKELRSIVDDVNRHVETQNKGNMKIPRELYWKLYDMDIYLRGVMDKAGYQTKRKDDFLSQG